MMKGSFPEKVKQIFLGTEQESVVFNDITQEYTHLKIISSQRIGGSEVGSTLTDGIFNDDDNDNYHTQRLGVRSDELYNSKWTDTDIAKLGWAHGDKAWEGAFVGQELTIYDYTNKNKEPDGEDWQFLGKRKTKDYLKYVYGRVQQ